MPITACHCRPCIARWLIVPIGLWLALPSPALALRESQEGRAVPELATTLTAGLEEDLWGISSETQFAESFRDFLRHLPQNDAYAPADGGLASAHIRHVVFFYPYTLYLGGASTYQRNSLEALLKSHRGLTLELLYLNFTSAPSRTVLDDPIRGNRLIFHGIPALAEGAVERSSADLAQRAQHVLGAIQGTAPIDLLVLNLSTPQYEMSAALLEAADRAHIPAHAYFHGGLITEGTRYLLRRADVAVTNSEAYRDVFQQLGTDVEVLRPVADLSPFLQPWTDQDRQALGALLKEHGLLGRRLVIHPGVIKEGKGQRDTVEAAGLFAQQHPALASSVAFVIIGPPRVADGDFSEVDRLRQMAREAAANGAAIVFVGPQSREQMRRWYHAADVVVYPTRNEEPFGLVPIEAQASGTPVIVTDVGGLPETLFHDERGFVTGLVTPKKDPTWLADALHALLSDELRHRTMAEAARRGIERRYAPTKTIQQLAASYSEAVTRRRTGIPSRAPQYLPPVPANPAAVLFNLYAPAPLRPPAVSDQELVEQWKAAWRARLDRAPRWWRTDPNRSFPGGFNQYAVNIAYDPRLIPKTAVGPFIRLEPTPAYSDYGYRTRGEPPLPDLSNSEFGAFLLEDPDDRNLLVLDNATPKVMYDSLLVTRYWEPQRLTRAAIRAELRWARRGLVVEFHHPERFVDYFHIHLNDAETVPITPSAKTFHPARVSADLALGVTDYPVPHFAIASSNMGALERAAFLLSEHLEATDQRFDQTLLPRRPDGQVVMLFYVLKPGRGQLSFSPLGVARAPRSPTSYDQLLLDFKDDFLDPEASAQIQDQFWRQWTTPAGLEEDDFIFELAQSKAPLTAEDVYAVNAWVRQIAPSNARPWDDSSAQIAARRLQNILSWAQAAPGIRPEIDDHQVLSHLQRATSAGFNLDDPIVRAALTHWLLTASATVVLQDGAHRTGWLIMNILLARAGEPMIVYRSEKDPRDAYHRADTAHFPTEIVEVIRQLVEWARATPYELVAAQVTDLAVASGSPYRMLVQLPDGVRTPCELFTTTGPVRIVCEDEATRDAVQRLVEEAAATGVVPGLTPDAITVETRRVGTVLDDPSGHTIFVRSSGGPAVSNSTPPLRRWLAIVTLTPEITTFADLLRRALAQWANRPLDSIRPFQRVIRRGTRLDLYA